MDRFAPTVFRERAAAPVRVSQGNRFIRCGAGTRVPRGWGQAVNILGAGVPRKINHVR